MKKIIFLLILFLLIPLSINAKTYKVELVKKTSELNNSTIDNYIIVNKADNGNYYAWSSTLLSGTNSKRAQAKNNAEIVTFNDDFTELSTDTDNNILWTFGLSTNSISESVDALTLVTSKNVYNDGENDSRNQINFTATDTATNPAGFVYTNNALPLNFKFINDEGNIRIGQHIASNNRTYYIRFLSTDNRFLAGDLGKASKQVKLYRVIEEYPKVQKYVDKDINEVISKTTKEDDTFSKSGILQVDIDLEIDKLIRNTDILFVLDYSNSMDYNDKLESLQTSTNYLAKRLLETNQNNRVGVIKFADGNIDEAGSKQLGLSRSESAISQFIEEENTSKLGGTNYTDAFSLAHEILSENAIAGKDQLIIFVTDGAPTIYNRTKFSVFKNTNDGIVGEYAVNWTNYFLSNKLSIAEKLKESGVHISCIGIGTNVDSPIKTDGSFVIKGTDANQVLKNIASSESDFYSLSEYEDLEDTYKKIFSNIYDKYLSRKVYDLIKEDYSLLTNQYKNKISYIEIKGENNKVIEKITFNQEKNEAYSSLINNKNILDVSNGNYVLAAETFSYDSAKKSFVFNLENLKESKIHITYFVIPTSKNIDLPLENPNTLSKNMLITLVLVVVSLLMFILNHNRLKTTNKYQV